VKSHIRVTHWLSPYWARVIDHGVYANRIAGIARDGPPTRNRVTNGMTAHALRELHLTGNLSDERFSHASH
jgi:hypothetical protein